MSTETAGSFDHYLWPLGIVAFFAIVWLMNGIYIYTAVSGADAVDPTWTIEENRK